MKPPALLGFTLLLVLALPAGIPSVRADELSDAEIAKMLDELAALDKKAESSREGKHTTTLVAFRAAAASNTAAYEFFTECYKKINFEEKERRFSEYREWKSDKGKELRSEEHCTALRYQLQWLIIAIRTVNAEDTGDLMPVVSSYMESLFENRDKMGAYYRLLQGPVTQSVFAEVYELDTGLGGLKSFEFTPANFDGIFDKTILPYYRAVEEVEPLIAAWDKRILYAGKRSAEIKLEKAKEDYLTETLPEMKWRKWSDVLAMGEKSRALPEMLALIKANLQHDKARDWISQLTTTLKMDEEPEEAAP